MAKFSIVSVVFFLLVIILAISEISTVKGKLCEKTSKTWFGTCKDTEKCDKQCIEWEGAQHGACHQREAKQMCYCYYECGRKDKSPPPPKSTPPKSEQPTPPEGGGQRSPPGDGQPAPPEGGGQPSPPGDGQPAPPEGGGQPSPPEGGQPTPPDGGQPTPSPPSDGGKPTPPPGCNKLYIDRLIAEAIANYKLQVEKESH